MAGGAGGDVGFGDGKSFWRDDFFGKSENSGGR